MTVYVDPPIHPWRTRKWCHMFADTEEELHTFADKLGLKREWFQDDWRLKHYDITDTKRRLAIKLGAQPVTIKVTNEHAKRNIYANKEANQT